MKLANRRPNSNGAAMLEFAAALPVLLMLIFFPGLNLVGIYSIYFAAATLNDVQVHKAALMDYRELIVAAPGRENGQTRQDSVVVRDIPKYWQQNGLGSYASALSVVKTEIKYVPASVDQYGVRQSFVQVKTNLELRPFLYLPYIQGSIAGVNAPFIVSITSQKLVEDPSNSPNFLAE